MRNIFNADKTRLFFRVLPNKALKFKDEKCVGGNMSRDRTGTNKLLVNGRAISSRFFKNVNSLPVTSENNAKAWMLDNCSAQPKLNNLTCVFTGDYNFEFTRGITKALKTKLRKL